MEVLGFLWIQEVNPEGRRADHPIGCPVDVEDFHRTMQACLCTLQG
jgi:hypothetical protein